MQKYFFRILTALKKRIFKQTSRRRRLQAGCRSRNNFFIEKLEKRTLPVGTAQIVEDIIPGHGINNRNEDSFPSDLVNVGGTLYFVANDGINGRELWRLTSSGIAVMVEDAIPGGGIAPGSASSGPESLINVNGTLYFSASDSANGRELWRVGTSGIATMVEDALPGDGLTIGSSSYPEDLTNVNGTLYFRANDRVNGEELWRINSSGVAAMVPREGSRDPGIRPGFSGSGPQTMISANGTLYFTANDGVNGVELWAVNNSGSAVMIDDAVFGGGIRSSFQGSYPENLTNVNGVIYFTANDGTNGVELWRISGGIAVMVEDAVASAGILPGTAGSSPKYLTNVNGTLYFRTTDGVNGRELWRISSSGLAVMVEDGIAGGGIAAGALNSDPGSLTNVAGTLYFRADDGVNGSELWRINSAGVAVIVEDSVPGGGIRPGSGNSMPQSLTVLNGTLYFQASDGSSGTELWKLNSTGTAVMIEDSVTGGGIRAGASGSYPSSLTSVSGVVYFTATDDINGQELWKLNPQGIAEMVNDSSIGPGLANGIFGSDPRYLTNMNGVLYFSGNDGSNGAELWRVSSTGIAGLVEDSTPGGGINSKGIGSQPGSGFWPGPTILVNGVLYFTANDGQNGSRLWRINAAGVAEMVECTLSGGTSSTGFTALSPEFLTNVNGTLYFRASDSVNGRELWRINSAGVGVMVEDSVPGGGILTGVGDSNPNGLTNVNGTLYFSARDASNGYELWRVSSSGVAVMVEDSLPGGGINPGTADSSPKSLTNVNGTLYFHANDGVNGSELWRVSGAGVAVIVEDSVPGGGLCPGSGNSNPWQLTVANGILYFQANDGSSGTELWRINSSGTAVMVEDAVAGGGIRAGAPGSYPSGFMSVNENIYFTCTDGINGHELWRINPQGIAEMIEDSIPGGGIRSGASGSVPTQLTNVSGRLYFRADDGINGYELWRLNSAGIAEIVEDSIPGGGIRVGSTGSSPAHLTNVSGTLYFQANDGVNGVELWRVNSTGVAAMVEDAVAGGGIAPGSGNGLTSLITEVNGSLANINGTLFFRANDGVNGAELWRINSLGLAEMIEDSVVGGGINPSGSSDPAGFVLAGGKLYFACDDGFRSGRELWMFPLNSAPSSLSLSSLSIAENLPANTSVGFLSATDSDVGDTLTYSLVNGTGAGDNASFVISGNSLKTASTFNFETKSSYSIRVRVTDQNGLFSEKTFTIQVTDAAEVNVSGTVGNDLFVATYTGNGTIHSWNVTRSGVAVFTGTISAGPLVVNGLMGTDTLKIVGRAANDLFQLDADRVTINGALLLLPDIETLQVSGGDGQDQLSVLASAQAGLTRSFDGGNGTDTVSAISGTNTWNLSGSGSGSLNSPGHLTLTTVESVVGGTGNDTFLFGASGSLTGLVSGGAGIDVLDFSAKTTASTVNLQLGTATSTGGISGIEKFAGSTSTSVIDLLRGPDAVTAWSVSTANAGTLTSAIMGTVSFSRFESLTGGTAADSFTLGSSGSLTGTLQGGTGVDTLTGPALNSPMVCLWNLNAVNGGFLTLPGANVAFSAFENLVGGTGADAFEMLPAGALTGSLNGGAGAGVNSLSYSGRTTAVTVNLSVTTPANATSVTGLVSSIQMVTGGAGNDVLTGRAALSTILIGLAGSDQLTGGSQRDLLFGGTGGDTLNAASGDDLLVSDATLFDIQRAAVLEIHAEWLSARTFAQRTANLWGNGTGTRSNGNTFLNNDSADAIVNTVLSDADLDVLTGASGQDWFFALAAETADFLGIGLTPDRRN